MNPAESLPLGHRRSDAGRRRLPVGLLACCAASPVLDLLTNVSKYLDRQDSLVALVKGMILAVLIAQLRYARSRLVIAGLVFIHVARELLVVLSDTPLELRGDTTFFLRILSLVAWLLVFHEHRADDRFNNAVLRIFVATTLASAIAGMIGLALSLDFFKAYAGDRNGY